MQLKTLPNFFFTNSTAIDTIPKKTGQFIVSKDDQVLYIDLSNTVRIRMDCVQHVQNESMLPLSPLDKIYVDDESQDLFVFINDDWVRVPSSENTQIRVTSGNSIFTTKNIVMGDGISAEQDDDTGDVTLSVTMTDYYLEFTSSNIDSSGILTLNDARVGTFVILDNNGKVCVPAMTQTGTSVQVNLYGWEVEGTWTIFFPMGASAGTQSVNDIVETIMQPNYVTINSTSAELDVEAGCIYEFTNPMTSLTLNTVTNSHKPTELRFKAGSNFQFAYETGSTGIVGVIGAEPTYVAGNTYHAFIRDSFIEIKQVTLF